MPYCHKCGTPWVSEKRVPSAKEYCENCSAWLHCCLNCKHHDPSAHNQCRIPNTEWVGDGARCNFCDEFEFREGHRTRRDSGDTQAFHQLFGGDDDGDEEITDIDQLFKE